MDRLQPAEEPLFIKTCTSWRGIFFTLSGEAAVMYSESTGQITIAVAKKFGFVVAVGVRPVGSLTGISIRAGWAGNELFLRFRDGETLSFSGMDEDSSRKFHDALPERVGCVLRPASG